MSIATETLPEKNDITSFFLFSKKAEELVLLVLNKRDADFRSPSLWSSDSRQLFLLGEGDLPRYENAVFQPPLDLELGPKRNVCRRSILELGLRICPDDLLVADREFRGRDNVRD